MNRVLFFMVLLGGPFLGAEPMDDQTYLERLGPAPLVVDPDWAPYETIKDGRHEGIAAELVELIAQRSGVQLKLLVTKDWDESVAASKDGRALVISFLNQTPKREEWLVFTEPYFTDPNVFITREEHDYISDPARLTGETVVLPKGTSIEERLRSEYPNLQVILTNTEQEAVQMVSDRKAHMTLRSLTMAAYTIKSAGLFNLKIAGQIPTFTNQFRMGVAKTHPRLRDILNQGVATITPQEVQAAVNRHISIKVQQGIDYSLILWLTLGFLTLAAGGFLWIRQLRILNRKLAAREAEKALILKEVHHRIKNHMATVQGFLFLQAQTVPDPRAAAALQDAQARLESMMVLYDKLYRTDDYGSLEVGPFLQDLVQHLTKNYGPKASVQVETQFEDLTLPASQLQPLSIILNELITNSLKYAFQNRDTGRLTIGLRSQGSQVVLTLADDGPGLPAGFQLADSQGFGMKLVDLMARQIHGTLTLGPGPGTAIELQFPRSPKDYIS